MSTNAFLPRLFLFALAAVAGPHAAAQAPFPYVPRPWARITVLDTEDLDVEVFWAQHISVDGKWIFFQRTTGFLSLIEIGRIRTDGTGYEILTTPQDGISDFVNPRASADGSKVVFVAGHAHDYSWPDLSYGDLWMLDTQTREITPLTDHFMNGLVLLADISWDGNLVAWHQLGGIGTGLYVYDVAKKKRYKVDGGIPVTLLAGLSGDGSVLSFVGLVDTPKGKRSELFVVHLDGPEGPGEPQRITFLEGYMGGNSMDDLGEKIVFTWEAEITGLSPSIPFVVRTDGSELRALSHDTNVVWQQPFISGDGSTALVTAPYLWPPDESGSSVFNIAVFDLKSGEATLLYPIDGEDCREQPSILSYDGRLLAGGAICSPLVDVVHSDSPLLVSDLHLPNLKVAGDLTPGTMTSATITGAPNARALLFAAADVGLLPDDPSDAFLLDPQRAVLLAAGRLDAVGLLEIRHLVPETLPFGADQIHLQAFVDDPWGFTNVVTLDVPP